MIVVAEVLERGGKSVKGKKGKPGKGPKAGPPRW